jgi:hypothetical protein
MPPDQASVTDRIGSSIHIHFFALHLRNAPQIATNTELNYGDLLRMVGAAILGGMVQR